MVLRCSMYFEHRQLKELFLPLAESAIFERPQQPAQQQ